jgi:catechol 2,3-dioxygenase-like lactoylglutathione lyase family enzyme
MGIDIRGIHHVGLVVRDLDRSIYFYHDLLGLPFANEPTPWFEGPALEQGVGVPGATLRQVCFWAGQHTMMELIEYGNRPAGSTAPVPNNHLGAAHVCFRVDDVRATKAELEAHGVPFYSDVNVVDEGPLAGWRWVYFSDPDGLALELVEVAYYLEDERRAASEAYLLERPTPAAVATRIADAAAPARP